MSDPYDCVGWWEVTRVVPGPQVFYYGQLFYGSIYGATTRAYPRALVVAEVGDILLGEYTTLRAAHRAVETLVQLMLFTGSAR